MGICLQLLLKYFCTHNLYKLINKVLVCRTVSLMFVFKKKSISTVYIVYKYVKKPQNKQKTNKKQQHQQVRKEMFYLTTYGTEPHR